MNHVCDVGIRASCVLWRYRVLHSRTCTRHHMLGYDYYTIFSNRIIITSILEIYDIICMNEKVLTRCTSKLSCFFFPPCRAIYLWEIVLQKNTEMSDIICLKVFRLHLISSYYIFIENVSLVCRYYACDIV